MKHFSTLLLALGLSATCAMGQNVTVIMKDGTSQKYNAEYLSEIYFREAEPRPDEVIFQNLDLTTYSRGNVNISMSTADGETVCEVDLYGTEDASFLQEGTYTVNSSCEPYTVDPAWSSVTIGGYKNNIVDGSVIVQIGYDGPDVPDGLDSSRIYYIAVNLELENGETIAGKYIGALPKYTPWINAVLNAAVYNANPQPQGQFYVKFNDSSWQYEMAMAFVAEPDATVLPSGTYTLNDFATPGSLLSASYVNGYSPYFHSTLLSGSKIIVNESNGTYDIQMDLKLSGGREATFSFNGQITGTPDFE